MSIQLRDGLANQPLDQILEDLLARFLVNVPDEDLSSIERVFFQVEEAQWFYTDFIRQLNPSLPSMRMKSFAPKLLKKCPLIWKWGEPADAIARFGKYKSTIPVRGVALFNKDLTKVLLVKGTESSTWSFPRGKISKDEQDLDCAIREVREETGFDATGYISEDDVIERTIHGKNYKIFLAKNVPEDYNFEPIARHEISSIKWHDIKGVQKKCQSNANHYFIVSAVLKPMLGWINRQKGGLNEQELMIKAEIKLKALLGLDKVTQSTGNDAGRELLNILQGVKATDVAQTSGQVTSTTPNSTNQQSSNNGFNPSISLATPYQQLIEASIPSYLQNAQFPYGNIPQGYPIPNQPFFIPPFPQQGNNGFLNGAFPPQQLQPPQQQQQNSLQQTPKQNISSPQYPSSVEQPNPQSFQKPTSARRSSEANSKELLSILNMGGALSKKEQTPASGTASEDSVKNKSKAQFLLDLVNKKSDEKPKKIQILKRPEQSVTPEVASPSTLKSQTIKEEALEDSSSGGEYYDTHSSSKELEASHTREPVPEKKKITLLKRQANENENLSPAKDILQLLGKPGKDSGINHSSKASNELLGLLRSGEPAAEKIPQKPDSSVTTSSFSDFSTGNTNIDSVENRVVPVKDSKEEPHFQSEANSDDFEDFENFEDFADFDESNHQYNQANLHTQFEVESDDEYHQPTDESHQYTSAPPPQPTNGGIHLNSINDLFASASARDEPSHKEKSSNSKDFLSILSKGNVNQSSPFANVTSPVGNPQIPSVQGISLADQPNPTNQYSNNVYGASSQNVPASTPNQSASQNLLSLLGKGPSQQPQQTTHHNPISLESLERSQQLPQQNQQQQLNYQSPYQNQNQVFSPPAPSNPLLDLLRNPKPKSNDLPSHNFDQVPNQTQPQQIGNSSARDLLNILKGGNNNGNASANNHPHSPAF